MADAGPPRALLGVGLCAWGFIVAKVAAALLLLQGDGGFSVLLALLVGFRDDALVTTVLLVASRGVSRVRAWQRAGSAALIGVGATLGLYAVLNVYLVAGYGSPLTASMLAYRRDADVAALWAPLPLTTLLLALGAFALGIIPVARLLGRARPLRLLFALAVLAIAGVGAPLLDEADIIRPLGLDRNAVTLLVASALPTHDDIDDDASSFSDPWPAPADPRFTAPVAVDTSRGRPRHVVLWLAESIATRHTSVGGSSARTTPRLEELSGQGLRFARYAANAPISAKAIFSTLCGYYPLPDAALETREVPRIACPSLMETLTAHGYDAALFHGGYFAFTDKLSLLGERGLSLLMDGESVPDRRRWFTNGWGIDDAALVERGLAWLDERQDPARPTLSIYIPLVPHYEYFLPPEAPRPFGERTLLDRYRNGVRYTDALFGKLVDAYSARGLLEDTLFVFVGDHGEAFEEHPRNKLHGGFLYEENVQTPLVLISPRLFPEGQVSERLGTHVDLVPTILSLIGVAAPPTLQGQSLVDNGYRYRPQLLGTWYPDPLLGLRDGDLKYVLNVRSGRQELYDLARDPGEHTNIAALFPERTRAFHRRLRAWEREQRRFLLKHPTKGAGYLDRVFASLEVAVVDTDGRETPCTRDGGPDERVRCEGDVWVGLLQERVFNMERRCMRVHPPATGRLRLQGRVSPAPAAVGIGLTDAARAARGSPLHADFRVDGHAPFTLTVDDRFESTSAVRALPKVTGGAPEGATAAMVEVELWSGGGRDRSACVMVMP